MRLLYRWEGDVYVSVDYDPLTYTHETVKVSNEEYEKYKDLLCSEDITVTKMILKIIQNERHT